MLLGLFPTLAVIVTVWPLAMTTSVPAAGTVPPGQGAFAVVEFQLPEPAVVTVAAHTEAGTRTASEMARAWRMRWIAWMTDFMVSVREVVVGGGSDFADCP